MEHDTKNKHRISDARWRDSVSRCYNLLKQCSHSEQDSTRMSILRLTLDRIQSFERRIEELGHLEKVKEVFGRGETLMIQHQQQNQQQQQQEQDE